MKAPARREGSREAAQHARGGVVGVALKLRADLEKFVLREAPAEKCVCGGGPGTMQVLELPSPRATGTFALIVSLTVGAVSPAAL